MRAAFYIALGALISAAAIAWWFSQPAPTDPRQAAVKILSGNGHGSGVHIGGGLVLTANHVIGRVGETYVKRATDGTLYEPELLWRAVNYDVALLRVPALEGTEAATLDCDDRQVDDEVGAYGNPLSLEWVTTWGRVTVLEHDAGNVHHVTMADMTVVGGMSGGPVFDPETLQLVGIVSLTLAEPLGMMPIAIRVPLAGYVPGSVLCGLLARG